MKRDILKYTAILLLVFGLAGCDDFLDVVPDSRTEVNSYEKVRKLLVSAYPTGSSVMMFETRSDNVMDNGSIFSYYNDLQHESFNFLPVTDINQDTPYYTWSAYYGAIAAANLALEAIEQLEDPSVYDAQKGEALLCRAWGHFLLANTFCMPYNEDTKNELGVPYSTEIETTSINTYERGTLEEVYRKIYQDIEQGLPLIDDTEYSQPKYHFNKKAANAFAAEFNLYYGNYEKAIEYATEALGNTPVLRDMAVIIALGNSPTDIRNQYIDSDEEANLMILPTTSVACCYGFAAYTRYNHTPSLTNTQTIRSPGPWGSSLMGYTSGVFGTSQISVLSKLYGIFEVTDVLSGVGLYHTVLMPFTTDRTVLNRAEAYIMLGRYDEAAADLNIWYTAKQLTTTNYSRDAIISFYRDSATSETRKDISANKLGVVVGTDMEYMIHACLHARRIETLHEGQRYLDLKRWGIQWTHESDSYGTISIQPYDRQTMIQLPEMVISAGMEPNPTK